MLYIQLKKNYALQLDKQNLDSYNILRIKTKLKRTQSMWSKSSSDSDDSLLATFDLIDDVKVISRAFPTETSLTSVASRPCLNW